MQKLQNNTLRLSLYALIITLPLILAVAGKDFFSFDKGSVYSINISFLLVFLGGLLAFLSPCAGFILPISSYFAVSDTKRRDISFFFLGLITLFIPLTFAGSIVAKNLVSYTRYFYYFAAILLIVVALNEFFKKSCNSRTYATPYVAGLSYSFTSIGCTGPILGAIITLTYAKGIFLIYPYILGIIFAFGMITPVILLSYIPGLKKSINKINEKSVIIRGRVFSQLQLLKSLSLLFSAVLIILLGSIDNNLYINITKALVEILN